MQRINESGRSMVEMLGVLAIIGLLSVGGIAGYIVAMNNHRANETVSDAMKMAVLVSAQRQLGQNGNVDGFKGGSPYTFTLSNAQDPNKTFTLTAADVPEAVRDKLTNMGVTLATVAVTGDDVTFTFNNDLSEGSGTEQGETCTGIKCGEACCPIDATCDPDHDNKCCIDLYAQGSLLCNYSPENLYCMRTDSNGDCTEWSYAAGPNSGSRIIGVPDANGAEASEGNEIYCMMTNSDGQCTQWASCEEGKSSGDLIIGASNGSGQCMSSDNTYLYCCSRKQNKDDPCASYCDCPNNVELTCWDEDSEGNCLEQACVY